MTRRSAINSFRRETDRFWALAAHPTLSVFAAGTCGSMCGVGVCGVGARVVWSMCGVGVCGVEHVWCGSVCGVEHVWVVCLCGWYACVSPYIHVFLYDVCIVV